MGRATAKNALCLQSVSRSTVVSALRRMSVARWRRPFSLSQVRPASSARPVLTQHHAPCAALPGAGEPARWPSTAARLPPRKPHRLAIAPRCGIGQRLSHPPAQSTEFFDQKYLLHRSLYCIVGCRRSGFPFRWCSVCTATESLCGHPCRPRPGSATRVSDVLNALLDNSLVMLVGPHLAEPNAVSVFEAIFPSSEVVYGDSDEERTH
jgi:hypothetical protein